MSTDLLIHSGTITRLLDASKRGDVAAMDDLFDRVYEELQQIARRLTLDVPARADLNPATLVNAACERLLATEKLNAEDRRHFFFIFGRAMHDVVVEEARRATAKKRTPTPGQLLPSSQTVHFDRTTLTLAKLADLLREFHEVDPDAAQVVRLRYFAGRSMRQTASDLGITLASVRAHWSYAKAWLGERVNGSLDS
ncbi:MAG: ECF-type sigma factor [Phycisphaera sp.]|nr:MAG: ECF-type sigma factor [Phycisphaera sp.]